MPALIRWQQRNGEDTNAIRMPGAMVLGIVLGGIAADAMQRNALRLLRPTRWIFVAAAKRLD